MTILQEAGPWITGPINLILLLVHLFIRERFSFPAHFNLFLVISKCWRLNREGNFFSWILSVPLFI